MHEDDFESFQKQMSDVKRLDANRVNLSKNKAKIFDVASRKDAAQKKTIRLSETVLPKDEFDQVDPREVLSFKKRILMEGFLKNYVRENFLSSRKLIFIV